MGKKSFNKRRGGVTGSGGGKRGGDGAGGAAPGVELMEVDPPPAVVARIERNILARQKVVLPSTVPKLSVPSFGAYVNATRAENPEEAIQALKIPDLRGIISTNEDPRLCADCSAALPGGHLPEVACLHMSCGAMLCDGCFRAHIRICTGSMNRIMMHVKAAAPWALYDEFPENSFVKKFCDTPQNISLAAKYAERALVLDPDAYRDTSVYIHQFLFALVKDGRLKEAKEVADPLLHFELDGSAKDVLEVIESATFGPFYNQLAIIDQVASRFDSTPSSLTSLHFLDQHNMSPEELRLADYKSGEGIFRMTCVSLKVLSRQLSVSSSPLLVGLGGLVSSMHYLMSQSVNRDLYRSIPTIMRKVAGVLTEVDPNAPASLLESEPFLLLMLTSVATHARTNSNETPVGAIDRNFRSITNAITKNPKLPNYLRALALVVQADRFCQLPNEATSGYSSNCPREVVTRRKARSLCLYVNPAESCPLKDLSNRLLVESTSRLANLQGLTRFDALETIASIRVTHSDGSADSEKLIEDVRSSYSNTVGGSGCDHCGKKIDRMLPTLLKCRRCCQAHFCSKECASLAWDMWHGDNCKKLGVFSVGDLVRVRGLGFSEGNGRIRNGAKAVITGEAHDGQWVVKTWYPSNEGTHETDAVSSKKLYHLRTLK